LIPDEYIWFTFSVLSLVPWLALYARFRSHRRVMLRASLMTLPFSLTGPLFIPEYWSPPSLFNLAVRTGFDIESPIFCFGIGGVAAVLYTVISRRVVEPMPQEIRLRASHALHVAALLSPTLIFVVLAFSNLNVMHSAIVALIIGGVAIALCRRDLFKQMWIGGVIFLGYYLLFLAGLRVTGGDYIERVWNMKALSGMTFLSFPVEELMWAFAFGAYWSGLYEYFTWTWSVRTGDRAAKANGGT
jgi:hypothetical protein